MSSDDDNGEEFEGTLLQPTVGGPRGKPVPVDDEDEEDEEGGGTLMMASLGAPPPQTRPAPALAPADDEDEEDEEGGGTLMMASLGAPPPQARPAPPAAQPVPPPPQARPAPPPLAPVDDEDEDDEEGGGTLMMASAAPPQARPAPPPARPVPPPPQARPAPPLAPVDDEDEDDEEGGGTLMMASAAPPRARPAPPAARPIPPAPPTKPAPPPLAPMDDEDEDDEEGGGTLMMASAAPPRSAPVRDVPADAAATVMQPLVPPADGVEETLRRQGGIQPADQDDEDDISVEHTVMQPLLPRAAPPALEEVDDEDGLAVERTVMQSAAPRMPPPPRQGQGERRTRVAQAIPELEIVPLSDSPQTGNNPRLKGASRDVVGVLHEISSNMVSIGYHQSNDVIVNHETVSGTHARIEREGDGWVAIDMNSTNGLFVNGKRVGRAALTHGDKIRLGLVTFQFEDPESKKGGIPGWLLAAGGVLAILVGAGVFFVLR